MKKSNQIITFPDNEIAMLNSAQIGEAVANRIVAIEGDIELSVIADLVKLNKSLTVALKDERVKAIIENEFDTYSESTIDVQNSNGKLNISQRAKFDFSQCGDDEYNSLIAAKKLIDDRMKAIEKRLKATDENGETKAVENTYVVSIVKHGAMCDIKPPSQTFSKVIKWTI